MKLTNKALLMLFFMAILQGCGVYSFTGDSIDYTKTKTISISLFYNDSGNGPPNLTQTFTEKLRDYFQQNTKLELVPSNGDLQLEGSITRYDISLTSATAAQNANQPDNPSQERLTIAVKASYINVNDDTQDFDKSFSFFENYDPNKVNFTAIEGDLIDNITEQIVIDIFNASVANW